MKHMTSSAPANRFSSCSMTQYTEGKMQPDEEINVGQNMKRKPEDDQPDASGEDEIDGSEMEEEDEDEQAIQDEYRLWKKNTPFLYDTVLTHCLTWPSLTCEWLPTKHEPAGADYSNHQLVLGTQTADGTDNYLMIASVKLPRDDGDVDIAKYDESAQPENGANANPDQYRIAITTRICHPGEVNKARYNPRNPFIIATKTISGDVLLFDYSKHPSKPKVEGIVSPQGTLKGHSSEGYALEWNRTMDGVLASGADDGLICVWDTSSSFTQSETQPVMTFTGGHTQPVESIAWNYFHPNTLVSVGDDSKIIFWDFRNPSFVSQISNAHKGSDINSVSMSPFTEFLFATGGADKAVSLWDSRKQDVPIYSLEDCHTGEITNVNWSPFSEYMIASSGNDRRVIVWDLSRIGDELTNEEASDGPPELLFMHSGHTGRVNDFCFNPNSEWTFASVADDNILQVWKLAENVYVSDSDDEAD
jgi:histone-binding protein RBBP4